MVAAQVMLGDTLTFEMSLGACADPEEKINREHR